MGKTQLLEGAEPFLEIYQRGMEPVEEFDGAVSEDGLVFGTYLHGLFDQVSLRVRIVNSLRHKKGIPPFKEEEQLSQFEVWERNYDKLADWVSQSIDLNYIINLLT